MALDAEDATALGYLFSNVSFPGASSVAPLRCTRATPAGAPLFAIPWAKCWTQEAAERCPEVEAALTVAGRRNPSCELLHRSSTWIVLHLLFESQTTPAPVQHVLRVTETGAQPLMFWAEEELQELRGSYWHQEALRRKEQLRLEYLELQEELGDEVSQRLGLSASGFLKAHMALLLAGLDFGDKGFVLLPGLQGTPSSTSQTTKRTELSADELSAAQGLQLLPMPGCGPVLVATARTSYAAGDLVEIFHRGQCLGSGCSLATFGSLPWCSAWEEVIVTLRLGPEVLEMGAVDFAQTAGQLEEALQRDLRERPPVQRAGLPLRPSPLGTGAVVRREGEDGAWEVRVSLDLQGPSSRSLQLLGLLSLMDLKKRKDMMMLECAWDDVMGEAACEHRGRRVLEEAIRRTLEQLPRPSLARATATERESMCIQLLENERKVLEGALEVQHAALSAASPPAPPVPTMRAYQPSVEPLLEVLQTLKARFQAQEHLPELQGQQLSEELSVTVALLLSDGQLGLELTDPTNESEKKSPIEVLVLEALLAQKLWQESKDSKVSRLLEVGALRFRLGDFAIALHDLTLVVEQEPANKEAVRLLERCEKEVAREVQEKAGYLYSLEWSDGEDASVVEALESERLRELQELSTTEAPNTPHAQRLRAVHLDRLGARRLGLRLRELVNGLEVEEIRDGVVKDWNATASPGERIGVGDKIVKVNQVRGSGRMLLAEFRKDQVLHLLVAPPGDDIVASEASNKVPPRAEELTWQDLSLQQLLGWSPPGLCDWQWHETPLQQATGLGPWKMAVVQLDGCTWTSEVDEVFMTSLECQERISFPSKSCLAKLQSLDLILVPLLLDEEVEELSELCEEVRRFLAELQEMDPFARIVALTCGSNGPDCFGARDDGFGMPAAAPARGMFRCFRLEHPETPILHIDTDAVGPGKTAELEAQIRRELTWRYNTQQASDLAFLGREVAYRRQRRFVPQLDVCRQAPARKRACLQRTGVALITGGTGGLGLTTAEVLVDAGVRHVVLCSRSGKVSADAPGQLMERLEGLQRTATVVLEACDAADEDQVLAMLQKLRTNYGPLRWVVNAAGIVRPSDTAEELKAVFQPKCLGAWHLHRHTLEDDLEAMWFFSSLSGGIGTEGLYNYAAANTYLDELAHVRRSAGLPATSIQFPEVEEAGMAAAYLGGGGGSATVSLSVVKLALRQLLLGDGPRASPVVALLPPGYLIARSVYHWLALEPLEKRRNKELWDLLAQTEKENKEEIRELRKELKTRRAEAATR